MEQSKTWNKKPVYEVEARSVINLKSGFAHKLLCDGPTFSTGTACAYSCAFCYVPDLMRKSPHMVGIKEKHHEVVVRRRNPVEIVMEQLVDRNGNPRFDDPNDRRVIYASPLVDVAANVELAKETVEVCKLILAFTNWTIRLLSKSNLLPMIAKEFNDPEVKDRIIYGVSTGTTNDQLARSFEEGTALPSRRLQSLHWLQDNGYRTYGMICPSLPQHDYDYFAWDAADAIRWEQCEHVWAEVLNVRGDSLVRTVKSLRRGQWDWYADALEETKDGNLWEIYARKTFIAHTKVYRDSGKLRFLQYVRAGTRPWWDIRRKQGAILL